MFSSMLFLTALGATLATAAGPQESTCSSGPVSKYMSLANYSPAQSYCSDNYPSPSTATVTSCATPTTATYTGVSKRDADSPPQWRGNHGRPIPSQSSDAVLFKHLTDQDSSLLPTFCSCIAPPPQIVTIQSTCASNEYCSSTTGTCRIQRDCANPAACDGHSFCGKGSSGENLFCHMDTDDSQMGYCMNDGPPDMGCPEPYEDCSSNADCGGMRVCIYSCCRAEPFCVDVRDYQDGGAGSSGSGNMSSRLLRRGEGFGNAWLGR